MIRIKLLLILPLIVTVRSQSDVRYYGTSNVRTQGLNLPTIYRPKPPPLPERQTPVTAAPPLGPGGPQRPSYIPAYRPVPPRPVGPIFQPAPTSTTTFLPPLEMATVPPPQTNLRPELVEKPESITKPQPMPVVTPQSDLVIQPEPIPDTTVRPESVYEPEQYPQLKPLPDPIPEPYPQPEPLPDPIPEPNPQSKPFPELIPEAYPQPKPLPELIPKPYPQPQPSPDLIPEPYPQPESLPDPIPEPTAQLESLSDPSIQPEPYPTPIPDSILKPQPIPKPTPKPGSEGIALLPLLPKPKPERPPAYIRPTYSQSKGSTPYQPTTLDPQPEPTTEIISPVTTTRPITSTYKSIHGGISVHGFDCNLGNRYYAIEGFCDQYIECKEDIAVRYICPDGLNFNPATKWLRYPCVYPSETQCEAGSQKQNPKSTIECPRQFGYFSMKDGECSKFLMCQEGRATVMDCPNGLVFNEKTSSCDWVENVPICNPYAFKDFKCPASHVDRDGQLSSYIYKYKYGNQCKLYVACQRGHPRLLSCDPGLYFHEPSQSCILEELVTDCATPYAA